jgi:type IV secretory pathway TrbD component
MTDDQPKAAHHSSAWLREDLQREYYAILDVVTSFDQRIMTVKGWSVTLSLAALGLGFQQNHSALFALAAVTGLGFWLIEVTTKRWQLRYYPRMRDIELAAYNLNHVRLDEVNREHHEFAVPLGEVSSPRIDMYWAYPEGDTPDWRTDIPWRRTPEEIHNMMRRPFWMPHTMLPHLVAVVLGLLLFTGALLDVPGLGHLSL